MLDKVSKVITHAVHRVPKTGALLASKTEATGTVIITQTAHYARTTSEF